MHTGFALCRSMTVGLTRQLIRHIAIHLARRHDMAPQEGELPRIVGDVAPNGHLGDPEQGCGIA
ncbi:hypothetical protein D3C87_1902740 [compost metagenome]